jgi:hypothetical protein
MNSDLTMVSRLYEISAVGHVAPARVMTPA